MREEIREGIEGILTDCWQEALRTQGHISSSLERDYADRILSYLHSKGMTIRGQSLEGSRISLSATSRDRD